MDEQPEQEGETCELGGVDAVEPTQEQQRRQLARTSRTERGNPLRSGNPAGRQPVTTTTSHSTAGWITFGVDSACCATCIPCSEAAVQKIPVVRDQKTGGTYRTANNAQVVDEGRRTFHGEIDNAGPPLLVHARTLKIKRPLMSVFGLTKAGYRVVFDADGSFAQCKKTGRTLTFDTVKRGWTLSMKVNKVTKSGRTSQEQGIEALKAEASYKDAVLKGLTEKLNAAEAKAQGIIARLGTEETTSREDRWCPFGRLPPGVRPAAY